MSRVTHQRLLIVFTSVFFCFCFSVFVFLFLFLVFIFCYFECVNCCLFCLIVCSFVLLNNVALYTLLLLLLFCHIVCATYYLYAMKVQRRGCWIVALRLRRGMELFLRHFFLQCKTIVRASERVRQCTSRVTVVSDRPRRWTPTCLQKLLCTFQFEPQSNLARQARTDFLG